MQPVDCPIQKLFRIWGPPGARGPGARAPCGPVANPPLACLRACLRAYRLYMCIYNNLIYLDKSVLCDRNRPVAMQLMFLWELRRIVLAASVANPPLACLRACLRAYRLYMCIYNNLIYLDKSVLCDRNRPVAMQLMFLWELRRIVLAASVRGLGSAASPQHDPARKIA